MKIIHVVPHVTNEASGPSYSVPALCRALGRAGADVKLMTQTKGVNEVPKEPSVGFEHQIFAERGLPKRLHPSRDMLRALYAEAQSADLIHNHSLWLWPNVYTGQVAKATNTTLVLSPRGTLAPEALARSKWIKRAFWMLAQKNSFDVARIFHATSAKECQEIVNQGINKPIIVLPNGIDIPSAHQKSIRTDTRTLLFLGRIHPIKGIDMLIDAWKKIPEETRRNWRLRIVGAGSEQYQKKLEEQVALARLDDVCFDGPVYGEAKTIAYQDADIYILPSRTENFGVTIAEALASGTPVMATEGTPWSRLSSEGAGWWVPGNTTDLTSALSVALASPPEELASMGASGRAWMKREFDWDKIAEKMLEAYHWQLSGRIQARPSFIEGL